MPPTACLGNGILLGNRIACVRATMKPFLPRGIAATLAAPRIGLASIPFPPTRKSEVLMRRQGKGLDKVRKVVPDSYFKEAEP